jgi:hypothetical protein
VASRDATAHWRVRRDLVELVAEVVSPLRHAPMP